MNQPPMLLPRNNNQRSYKPWSQLPRQHAMDPNITSFQQNHAQFFSNFAPSKPRSGKNWKGKNVNNRNNNPVLVNNNNTGPNPSLSVAGGYKPPSLNELQTQNRLKARKFYHFKKKFNNRSAPYAPRNTSSFIIRAKKSGGITSLVSPCPVTPAVLPTPVFSPSREVLVDMAKEEWGVDGYGSMKGLIRLRIPGHEVEGHDEEEDEDENGSSESDVEEHVEVERRLDHDLSRFEMIYPNSGGIGEYNHNNLLENRVDDQDTHIAQLEEENLTLKERLFLMESELRDLRRRLLCLEKQNGQGTSSHSGEDVSENNSDNDENENGSDGESRSKSNDVKEGTSDSFIVENKPEVEAIISSDAAEVEKVEHEGVVPISCKEYKNDVKDMRNGEGTEVIVDTLMDTVDKIVDKQVENEILMGKETKDQ